MGKTSRVVLLLFLIAAASVVAQLTALTNGFTNWDDPSLLLDNQDIRGLSAANIGKIFTTSYGGLGGYTPLVLLSYAVEYHLFGLEPRVFHTTNLLLHAVNALLIFWLFNLIGAGEGISFLTAVLFAVHPLHVEPVAWIQGRKDLLFSLFFLSGLICYAQFIRKSRKPLFYLASLLLFSLSLLSKITAMSFPLIILLLEKHLTKTVDKFALRRSLPFWLLSGLFWLIAFITNSPSLGQPALSHPSYLQNLMKFFYAFAFYARRIYAPFGLSPRYSDHLGQTPWLMVLDLVVLVAVCALLVLAYRRKPGLASFGIGFAVLTLLPTLPFHFFGQPYADRYMYLPIAGILLVTASLFPETATPIRLLSKGGAVAGSAFILAAVTFGMASWNLDRIWHDSLSLWSYVIKTDRSNLMGHLKRAEAMSADDRLSEAMSEYMTAATLAPESPFAPQGQGTVYFKMGDYGKAMAAYDRALSLNPLFYEGYMSRGILWARLGAYDRAISDFTTALKLNKTHRAFYLRALAFRDAHKLDQAIDDLKSAYAIEPTEQVRYLILQLSAARNQLK